MTEFPTEPVKAGDTVKYTVEIDPNGNNTDDWFLVVEDALKAGIEGREDSSEKVALTDNKAEVSYKIPENFDFFEVGSCYVNFILTDGLDPSGMFYRALAFDYSHDIPVHQKLKGAIEFQDEGLVAGKEYPFTVTWSNTTDSAIDDFSIMIWGADCYANFPTVKVTEYPVGAVVKDQESTSVTVEKMSVPANGTVKVSGTVRFPKKMTSVQLRCNEIKDGKPLREAITRSFSVAEASGDGTSGDKTPGNGTSGNKTPGNGTSGNKAPGNGTSGNKAPGNEPGTENSWEVLKDNTSGITVSGVEEGVKLKVESVVSREQRTAIEEKVKTLVGDNKGIEIFDISLWKNNTEIQPGVPVKVTMPIPEGFSKNLRLYHQNAQGELEKIDISVEDSTVSFEAKSFSPYILVDLGEEAANSKGTTQNLAPKTADTSSAIPYIILALAAMGSMCVVTRTKSKN